MSLIKKPLFSSLDRLMSHLFAYAFMIAWLVMTGCSVQSHTAHRCWTLDCFWVQFCFRRNNYIFRQLIQTFIGIVVVSLVVENVTALKKIVILTECFVCVYYKKEKQAEDQVREIW